MGIRTKVIKKQSASQKEKLRLAGIARNQRRRDKAIESKKIVATNEITVLTPILTNGTDNVTDGNKKQKKKKTEPVKSNASKRSVVTPSKAQELESTVQVSKTQKCEPISTSTPKSAVSDSLTKLIETVAKMKKKRIRKPKLSIPTTNGNVEQKSANKDKVASIKVPILKKKRKWDDKSNSSSGSETKKTKLQQLPIVTRGNNLDAVVNKLNGAIKSSTGKKKGFTQLRKNRLKTVS